MIANKHISKIIIAFMAVAVCLCIFAVLFSDKLMILLGGENISMEYETALFDTSEIIEINIKMDEKSWANMLANAMTEEYYACDVVVNGTAFKNVAIRPKGNTSLSAQVARPQAIRLIIQLMHHLREQSSLTHYSRMENIIEDKANDRSNMPAPSSFSGGVGSANTSKNVISIGIYFLIMIGAVIVLYLL